MKPTEKQVKVIDTILSIIKSWKNTNDINSPTNSSDIHEYLFNELEILGIITLCEREEIEDIITDLLYSIQCLYES